jgi:hypothetical protein
MPKYPLMNAPADSTADSLADSPALPNPTARIRLGFALLVLLIAMAAASKAIVADTLDPDCFWHLRVGQELIGQSWPHPLVDDLSFASSKAPWTPYSWLAEIGMVRLWDAGGYRAAVALQAGMQGVFILLIALGAVEMSKSAGGKPKYLAAIIAAIAAGIFSLAYLSFRPVTGALVLMAGIAWLFLRDRRMGQKSKAVWIALPLTVLTANIHFYALLIPLWAGALFVGDALENYCGGSRQVWRGLILTILCVGASLASPMTPGTLKAVVDYGFHDVIANSHLLAEMQPFYAGTMGHVSAFLAAVIAICVIVRLIESRKSDAAVRLGIGELIWLAGCTVLLFKVGRTAPIFAIIACPIFAASMPNLADRILGRPALALTAAGILIISSVKLIGAFPPSSEPVSVWLNRHGRGFPAYPCGAADFVQANIPPVSGHILCEFHWGGYLEWRLGNRFQMLMDGRTQVFSAEFWRSAIFGSNDDLREVIEQSHADAAIVANVPASRSRILQILKDLHWTQQYSDDFAIVFTPPIDKGRVVAAP